METQTQLLTRAQTAELLHVSINTLDSSLKIPKVKIGPRHIFYKLSDIQKYIDDHTFSDN